MNTEYERFAAKLILRERNYVKGYIRCCHTEGRVDTTPCAPVGFLQKYSDLAAFRGQNGGVLSVCLRGIIEERDLKIEVKEHFSWWKY